MKAYFLIIATLILTACGPVKTTHVKEYTLDQYSSKKFASSPRHISILVSPPESVTSMQKEQMQYVTKPYELQAFTKNSWASPPANMLYPLIIQSLQRSNYFYAVVSGVYADTTDYRLDTQLIDLKQNFITHPSTLEFSAKVTLTNVKDNKIIASKTYSQRIPCPHNSPYGGVMAANKATLVFTQDATNFTIGHLRHS